MNTKKITGDITVDATSISFIASHEKVDRDGEVILVSGIDTSEFMKNPVLISQHDSRAVAVARVTNLRTTSIDGAPALVGTAVFPDRPQSNEAKANIDAGLLGAVSIGFRSVETGPPRLKGQSGVTHTKIKLLEISLVTLPACPTCLITSKAACDCESVLPPAPSPSAYRIDALARTVAHSLAKSMAPAAWEMLDDNQKDATTEMVDRILRQTVSDTVVEAVRSEVRAQINYACGRVD